MHIQWGTQRFLTIEEKEYGSVIDEKSDVYYIGILIKIFLIKFKYLGTI